MKKLELAKKKDSDLEDMLGKMKKELFNLKSASLAGEDTLKKKARVKSVKRDIARIKTRLNQ
ncbi:50S ribosomal protein L29 [Candidatus Woesearchaeota archaeon]|nr:50S ribosomal protein L29 [Nanoarchaeota archaeon]MCB9370328.1 50S ribosomal protein L29 [Candidatus Woesearchaeota archaeon]USN44850.1 MAG: 50S ribosomal protein L29 [Candidatus Woesearchaeota archaeon]